MSDLQLWFPQDFNKRYTEYRKKLPDSDTENTEPFLVERMATEKESILAIKNETDYQEEIDKWKPLKIIVDAIYKELSPHNGKAQSVKIDLSKLDISDNMASSILVMLTHERVCRWRIDAHTPNKAVIEYLDGTGIIVPSYEKFRDLRKEVNNFHDFIETNKEKKFPKVNPEIEQKLNNEVLNNSPISLKENPINFIDDEAKLKVNDMECEMPPYKSEHYLCRVMFNNKYPIKKAIDWEEVFGEMEQLPYKPIGRDTKKDMKSVQDTMYALNKRVRDIFHTKDDLFSWKNKCVVRNF